MQTFELEKIKKQTTQFLKTGTKMRRSQAPSSSSKRVKTSTTTARKASTRGTQLFRSVGPVSKTFPKQLEVSHRYVIVTNLNQSAQTAPVTIQVSVNGMFQPNSGGHQPYYFDQVSQIYNTYTVMKSKCTVTFSNVSASIPTPTVAGIYIEDDSTITPNTILNLCEANGAVYGCMTNIASDAMVTRSKSWSANSAFGGNTRDNDNLQGSSSANPTTQQFYTIFSGAQSTGVSTTITSAYITVEYTAIWDNLKQVVSS